MKNPLKLSRIEKLELAATCVEGATGVIGVSIILTEKHPYITIAVLAVGAVATKILNFIQKKASKEELPPVN